MTSLQAYHVYMRVAYFAALRGDFDFEADYGAYCMMADGNIKGLIVGATFRRRKLGVKPSRVKFHKKGDKSFAAAVKVYDAAKEKHYKREAAGIVKLAPMHLVKLTGEQGDKKRDGNLVAHYSRKRPKRVLSAFGEADNTEVFDA